MLLPGLASKQLLQHLKSAKYEKLAEKLQATLPKQT